MISIRFAAPLCVITLASCGGGKSSVSDSIAVAKTPAPISTSVTPREPARNPCEHTGLWAACTLERRLKQSGFVVRRLEETRRRAGFSVKPIVYSLGSARMEVFFYNDARALERDLQGIDTVTAAPRGAAPAWPSSPIWIRSANLAAVLLTQNQRQSERVVLAITAGPPQPGSPR